MPLKLLFKGRELMARSGEVNPHRLSLKAQISYPTIERLINRPETMKAVDLTVFAALITNGLGLTPEEAGNLKLSDVFRFVETDGGEA